MRAACSYIFHICASFFPFFKPQTLIIKKYFISYDTNVRHMLECLSNNMIRLRLKEYLKHLLEHILIKKHGRLFLSP